MTYEKEDDDEDEDEVFDEEPKNREEELHAFLEIAENLGYLGFVLDVHYPVGSHHSFDKDGKVTSYSCSWGHAHTFYVYGDDMAQAIEAIEDEAERLKEYDAEQSRKKKKEEKKE